MTTNRIIVIESPVYQASWESIPYNFNWSGTPGGAGTVALYDLDNWASLGTANLSGNASLAGTVITSPEVYNLTNNKHYMLVSLARVSGRTPSMICEIICQDGPA